MLFATLDPFRIVTEEEVRRENPNTGFPVPMKPEDVKDFGYVPVYIDPEPPYQWGFRVERGEYRIEDDVVYQGWNVTPISDEEKQIELENSRANAITNLNYGYQDAVYRFQQTRRDYDVNTWARMGIEARRWDMAADDNKPVTPLLSVVHASRQALGDATSFADFIAEVLADDQSFTQIMGKFVAVRQMAEKAIAQADTPDNVYAVTWNYDA